MQNKNSSGINQNRVDRAQYDYADEGVMNNRSHLNTLPVSHIRHQNSDPEYPRDDRYPLQSTHLAAGRREQRSVEEYRDSPHRGGGGNRRVLNAM